MTSLTQDMTPVQAAEKRQPIVWWYLILSCFYYYSFVFTGLELVGYAIFYGIPLVYLCLNYRYLLRIVNVFINSWLKYFLLLFLVFTVATALIPLFTESYEFSYLTSNIAGIFKQGLKVLFLFIVFLKHISPRADWRLFIKYFIWVNVCYVLVTMVFLFLPPLKNFWVSLLKEGEHAAASLLEPGYVTRYGWMGFSGFYETFLMSITIALQCYLLSEKTEHLTFRDLIPLFLLLVGTLFYGRIGFLVSLCVVALFFFFRIFIRKPSLLVKVFAIVMGCIVALLVGYMFSETIRNWVDWAFMLFINLFAEGRVGSTSTDILFNDMIFLPEPRTMLFGDGYFSVVTGYYMNTDSGLLRPLLFGGIFFVFVRYALVVFLMLAVFPLKGENRNASAKFLVLSIILVLVLFEIKGGVVESALPYLIPFATMVVLNYLKKTSVQGELYD